MKAFIGFIILIAVVFCLTIIGFDLDNKSGPTFSSDFGTVIEKRSSYAKIADSEHVDFQQYFDRDKMQGVKLRTVIAGELVVSSGKLIACDPFYVGEEFTYPFKRTVEPGKYPVVLSLGKFADWGERVAFAKLKFTDAKPVRWELAKTTEEDSIFWSEYGVDAGLGAFADLEAANLLETRVSSFYSRNPEGNYYDDVLAPEFAGHEDWNDHRPVEESELNVVMFSSGVGDGEYSSFWGIDEAGDVVCLVTDFQLFTSIGSIFQE